MSRGWYGRWKNRICSSDCVGVDCGGAKGLLALCSILEMEILKMVSSVDRLWPLLRSHWRRSLVICRNSDCFEFCLWYVESKL